MSNQGGIKDLAKGRSDVYRLAPSDIHIREGWNARDFADPADIEHVESLAVSIAEIFARATVTPMFPNALQWSDADFARLQELLGK